MGVIRLKLTHVWAKMVRYIPFLGTIRHYILVLRWAAYEKRTREYKRPDYSQKIGPKVLILMGTAIGDTIEATPLVQAVRMFWPQADITIRSPWPDLYENWCVIDRIIKEPQEIKGKSFDHTFVAFGGSISLFKGACDLGIIHYTEAGLGFKWTKSESQYNMDMLIRLGYHGLTPPQYVSIRKPDNEISFSPLTICLVPGCTIDPRWSNRRWPYFQDLAKILLDKYSEAKILIIGMPQDMVRQELLDMQGVIDLRGQFALPEVAWVFRKSKLAVGNDCGPMHIACTVQTPSIFLFGPTCDSQSRPVCKGIALRKELDCAPCIYDKRLYTCDRPVCMEQLKPEDVLRCIEKILR